MFASLLILATTYPITRVGTYCPYGYYNQGSYCVPSATAPSYRAIPRSDSTCPYGTYVAGNYCSWKSR